LVVSDVGAQKRYVPDRLNAILFVKIPFLAHSTTIHNLPLFVP